MALLVGGISPEQEDSKLESRQSQGLLPYRGSDAAEVVQQQFWAESPVAVLDTATGDSAT